MTQFTATGPHHAAAPRRGRWPRLRDLLALRRQRNHLARLDDHLLNDIGLTRHQAMMEAERPAWDVPSHWRRG
ncbi:DUF1127 domain-containing protein [Limimaricola pyoseonensis]|uniref:Uncharacterized conserved protein YjiS, DUF1127 family n=1 Tax=Limimaricola pyoseonensis TaxID=521013 RepID=A0A1G7DI26_9RHOB|nr:DUF1127 domain-containing protein [Limimaricola pyoseonensis]SDE50736.1 Uncharacterized conserved protein YjiS, DUF1127 family [Limimaricola pyoseonensis]